ncbi:MAG: hypothetical protein WC683_17455 [bacterium]
MHTLITGVTECGKTTLGKRLAKQHRDAGIGVLVLTAVFEKWPCDYITTKQSDFLDTFWGSRSCMAFVDEAGETVGHYTDTMKAIATRGRHYGHSCYFLVQRPKMIDPNVRGQCTQLFCFSIGQEDADDLAREWNQPELKNASKLRKGEYYRCLRFNDDGVPSIEKGALW